jgi:hypothetical protein
MCVHAELDQQEQAHVVVGALAPQLERLVDDAEQAQQVGQPPLNQGPGSSARHSSGQAVPALTSASPPGASFPTIFSK